MENKIKESKSLEIIIEEPHNFKKRNFNKNIKKTKSLFNIQNNLFKEILSKNDYINKENIKTKANSIYYSIANLNDKNNNENNKKYNKKILNRPKSHSLISFKSIINNDKKIKFDLNLNNFSNEFKNNIYITSIPKSEITDDDNRFKANKNSKDKINKQKNLLKKKKSSLVFLKKTKSIEEIIREKELNFERNYKSPKNILYSLNIANKNRRKVPDKFKEKYINIKSNYDKMTKNYEKRKKINLFKLKKYSLFNDNLKAPFINIIKTNEEIHKLRKKEYLTANNLEALKQIEKTLKTNELFFENEKRPDILEFSRFSDKIKELDGLVAYKFRYLLANKIGYNWDDIYLYKKNQRKLIIKNRKRERNINFNDKSKNEKPDDILI